MTAVFAAGGVIGLFIGVGVAMAYHRHCFEARSASATTHLRSHARPRPMAVDRPPRRIAGNAVDRRGNVVYCDPDMHR